jgi:hypothetical protein
MAKNRRAQRETEDDEFDFFDLDPLRLDEHWVEQARLFFRYSVQTAEARQEVNRLKAELDVVAAELDQAIREDPDEFNIAKPTEAAIKAAIPLQDDYRAAQKALFTAMHDQDIYQAACGALEHRKRALEKLVDLAKLEWFAEPRASEESRDVAEKLVKEAVRRKKRRREDE